MKKLSIFLLAATLFSCHSNNKPKEEPRVTVPVENIVPTANQQTRRERSEAICRAHHIPIYKNPGSLFVDPEAEVTIRTKDEVVDRAIALCYLELKSEHAEAQVLADFDKRYNVMAKLTPAEKAFALNPNPTEQQMTDANWRAEGFHVMLWVLSYADTLKYPNEVCSVPEDVKYLFSKTEKEFRDKAKLRSKAAILDEADLILRFDWACVNERLKPVARPAKEDILDLNKDVVSERHYSLNWLIRYMDQAWDDISTDT